MPESIGPIVLDKKMNGSLFGDDRDAHPAARTRQSKTTNADHFLTKILIIMLLSLFIFRTFS